MEKYIYKKNKFVTYTFTLTEIQDEKWYHYLVEIITENNKKISKIEYTFETESAAKALFFSAIVHALNFKNLRKIS